MTRSSVRQQAPGIDFRREAEAAAKAAGLSVDDWTRSVLGERGAPREVQPPPAASAGEPAQPVERILSSLDRLGERIRALSARPAAEAEPENADPVEPDEVAEATPPPAAPRRVVPAAQAPRAARASRGGIELQKAIEQIARTRDALDRASARAEEPTPEPIPEPEPPTPEPPRPDALAGLKTELAAIREAVDAGSAAPRLAALEASYDEVVRRLDQLRGAIDNPRTIADLVQRLSEIRRLLAQAPTEAQLAAVTDRIERIEERLAVPSDTAEIAELSGQVAELANAVAGLDSGAVLAAIDSRLDRVIWQVGLFEKKLSGLESIARVGDGVEKQAAVLSVLAQRSEQIPRVAHEMERQSAAVGELARQVEALPQLMTDVAELRGTMDAEATRTRRHLEEVLARIEEMSAEAARQPTAERLAEYVDARLADIGRRFEEIASPLDAEALAAVEARMGAMAASVERRLADLAEIAARPVAVDLPAELADALARIEAHLAADRDDTRLEAIEARIAGLADAVADIGTPELPDLGALEAEVASMRREIAALAAPVPLDGLEREVRALSDAMARMQVPGFDPAVLDRVELRVADIAERLDARIAEVADRVERAPGDAALLESALARFEATLGEALAADGPVAAAATAAARAAVAKGKGPSASGEVASLRADIDALRTHLRDGADRDRALLIAIGEAVERLASRDEEPAAAPFPPVEVAPPAPRAEAAPAAVAAVPPAPPAEAAAPDLPTDPAADRDAPAAEDAPRMDRGDADAWDEIGRSLAQSVGLRPAKPRRAPEPAAAGPSPEATGFRDTGEQPLDLSDDSPLEPGSGKPAAVTPPAVEAERREPSKADFIAAARRAAQAAHAAAPAMAKRPTESTPDQPARPGRRSRRDKAASGDATPRAPGRLGGLLGANRRKLLTAAAVVVLAFGATSAVLQVLRSPSAIDRAMVEVPAPASLAASDAGAEAEAEVVADLSPAAELPADDAPPVPADTETAELPSLAGDDAAAADAPAIPPAAIVDETATAAVPLGPGGAFAGDTAAPPSDKFVPREPESPAAATTASLGDAATGPAARATAALPAEEVGPLSLRQAAADGDAAAQFEVAVRLTEGRVVQQDLAAAARWYELAAENGLPLAQYRLGSLYEKGQGVPRDLAEAIGWYTRAAEAGNAKAMHNLAVLSAEGHGGDPDYDAAARWFTAAAEKGVRDSQYNLGILSAKGLGVPRDLAASYKWFAIAAAAGDADAARKRDDVAQVLDQDTLARARLAVETWTPTPASPEANEPPVGEPSWYVTPEATASLPATGGDMVTDAQTLLAGLGYDPGPADGKIGERTRLAIEAFQRERGLPVTGTVDPDLLRALAERRI